MISVVLELSKQFGHRYYLDSICEMEESFKWKSLTTEDSDDANLLDDLHHTSHSPDIIYLQHSTDDKDYFIKPLMCTDLYDMADTNKYMMCASVTKRDLDGLLGLDPKLDGTPAFFDYLDTHFMGVLKTTERLCDAITKELYTKDCLISLLTIEYQDVWDHVMPKGYKAELERVYNPTGRLESDLVRLVFVDCCIRDFFDMTNRFYGCSFYENKYPPDQFFSCHVIEDKNGETLQVENLVNYGYAKHDGETLFFTDHVFADCKSGTSHAPVIDANGNRSTASWNIFCQSAYDCDSITVAKSLN